MNKRVHEIAKERGLEAKYVLARLKAAGVDVKASSSSVDEEVARRVLSNGGDAKNRRPAPAKTEEPDPPAKAAASTKRKPAPAATAQHDQTVRPVRDEPAPGDRAAHGCARTGGASPRPHRRPSPRPHRRRRQPRLQPATRRRRPAMGPIRAAASRRTSVRRATRCRASERPATRAVGAGS